MDKGIPAKGKEVDMNTAGEEVNETDSFLQKTREGLLCQWMTENPEVDCEELDVMSRRTGVGLQLK